MLRGSLFTALLMLGTTAFASNIEEVSIERSRALLDLTVDLNETSVRCLVGDYGASSLKISVPGLVGNTLFRHTTRGETQPCINAGPCKNAFLKNGLDPSMILDSSRPTEDIQLTIVLNEELLIDHSNKTCERTLRETVTSHVRGLDFRHQDGRFIGELDYDLCLRMRP